MTKNYQIIWESKIINYSNVDLQSLIKEDVFDLEEGCFSLTSVEQLFNTKRENTLFEISCDNGNFIFPFFQNNVIVRGVDYSSSLISIAQEAMPQMSFSVSEADKLYFTESYDDIVSNSVFQYFSDLNYAETVVRKMFMMTKKGVAILDINDKSKLSLAEHYCREGMSIEDYNRKYSEYRHLYYEKEWFLEILQKLGSESITIYDQNIKDYKNSLFRFNIFVKIDH